MSLAQAARVLARGLLLSATVMAAPALGHSTDEAGGRLPVMGAAPGFTLTDQTGAPFAFDGTRGKVVAVSFLFTSCADTCPLLTDKLARIAEGLGADFGSQVAFISITVDPANDDPATLKDYAEAMGADLPGWTFLTGTPEQIREVAGAYGVYIGASGGQPSHNLMTSIVDRDGQLRVQYMGQRFDPEEFLHDLRDLIREGG